MEYDLNHLNDNTTKQLQLNLYLANLIAFNTCVIRYVNSSR